MSRCAERKRFWNEKRSKGAQGDEKAAELNRSVWSSLVWRRLKIRSCRRSEHPRKQNSMALCRYRGTGVKGRITIESYSKVKKGSCRSKSLKSVRLTDREVDGEGGKPPVPPMKERTSGIET